MRVDPRVDYAFKKLLGSPENTDLLLDFLNSVLKLDAPITSVVVRNPFNEREFEQDKLSVVDVKATDATGFRFQVEIQLMVHPALAARVLYTWARVYVEQLGAGDDYEALRPTFAIWLLDDVLLRESPAHHHRFRVHDPQAGVDLSEQLSIHLIELPKWTPDVPPSEPESRWLYFFRNAGQLDSLPPALDDPTMRKAMGVLKEISEQERDQVRYRIRADALSLRTTLENARLRAETRAVEAEEALATSQDQLADAETRLADQGEALARAEAELARLRAQLGETPG
ncbi:MAG: Rpn family recombination-promoting nuclease/putative transposase [Alphaproteobacteria bacterium]|nr:Rpn family recombination-promoting nuclease/putative transposase [Alphaproteobacteria bacterium]MCB9794776.1 Rpn family recombination-promoting nuclease/putative transposase [Alphaproteobacteria bacterium]